MGDPYRIVAYGDSIAEGLGYASNVTSIALAGAGFHASRALPSLHNADGSPKLQRGDRVIVSIGWNDIDYIGSANEGRRGAYHDRLVARIHEIQAMTGAPVIVVGMKNERTAESELPEVKRANAMLEAVATETGATFLDTHHPRIPYNRSIHFTEPAGYLAVARMATETFRDPARAHMPPRRAASAPAPVAPRPALDPVMQHAITLAEQEFSEAEMTQIQQGLIAKGYDIGPSGADGDVGPNTIRAWRAYEAAHALPPELLASFAGITGTSSAIVPDGIISRAEADELNGSTPRPNRGAGRG